MAEPAMDHWRTLTAVCAMMWGISFIYDIPAPLSIPLSEHLSLSEPQYAYLVSILYAVYSAPNTVLPFFSGAAVRRFGERTVLLVTLGSVVGGQLLFALAIQARIPLGMVVGRAFIGFGGEIIGVLGSEITTRWFKDKQLSLALAMNLGISRLGSAANTILIPRLIESYGVLPASWIGTVISLGVSILGAIYLLAVTVTNTASPKAAETQSGNSVASFRQFPRIYWQLGLVCVLGYGGVNTFTNSSQRFLASRFYGGDQRMAGSATSIPYILSGVLVLPFGLLLDQPWFSSYPRALISANILMTIAHFIFLSSGSGGIGPILPLGMLGVAYALYGVAFWAGLARCLLFVVQGSERDSPCESEGEGEGEGGYRPTIAEEESLLADNSDQGFDAVETPNGGGGGHSERITTLGFGIITSLLNMTTAVVPIILAGTENIAGYSGLEAVFLALAVFGWMASAQLAWMWDI